MNETIHPASTSDVPWPTSDDRMPEPDISMLPDSETVAPAAQKLGESVAAVEDALHVKAEALRATRDEWVESVRATVRVNPLVAVAAAVTLGLVIARITR